MGVRNLIDQNPGWSVTVYTDADIDAYLEDMLVEEQWAILKGEHIVAKSDLWRLLKIYFDGGCYMDIDRLVNVPMDEIVTEGVEWVLPTCLDHDFSHDFMCSAPGNPAIWEAARLNILRRLHFHKGIYLLGPQTWMHAVSYTLIGRQLETGAGPAAFAEIREQIAKMPFVKTYRESPPYDTITYRHDPAAWPYDHEIEKRRLYADCGMKHWTGEW
jgi:hypothetical protein